MQNTSLKIDEKCSNIYHNRYGFMRHQLKCLQLGEVNMHDICDTRVCIQCDWDQQRSDQAVDVGL